MAFLDFFRAKQKPRATAVPVVRGRYEAAQSGDDYKHWQQADELVVIADEQHVCYSMSAKAFTKAIDELAPAALIGLTKALAIELAPDIRVNCVAPGVVRTPMQERLEGSMTPEQWQAVVAAHPLGIGTPEDVAQAIEYLLRQRWTTGTVLTIDGGYTSR